MSDRRKTRTANSHYRLKAGQRLIVEACRRSLVRLKRHRDLRVKIENAVDTKKPSATN